MLLKKNLRPPLRLCVSVVKPFGAISAHEILRAGTYSYRKASIGSSFDALAAG